MIKLLPFDNNTDDLAKACGLVKEQIGQISDSAFEKLFKGNPATLTAEEIRVISLLIALRLDALSKQDIIIDFILSGRYRISNIVKLVERNLTREGYFNDKLARTILTVLGDRIN